MRCPQCGFNEDRVLDTRELREGEVIRRRRECLKCRSRFSTLESLTLSMPLIVKKDGRREPFSKDKVLKGIQAACQKRSVPFAQLEVLVERIANWANQIPDKEVSSHCIGQKVMQELRFVDDVAYVRFASVYRNFKDVAEFVETLEHPTTLGGATTGQLSLTPARVHVQDYENETSGTGTCTSDAISNGVHRAGE